MCITRSVPRGGATLQTDYTFSRIPFRFSRVSTNDCNDNIPMGKEIAMCVAFRCLRGKTPQEQRPLAKGETI
jgi:hypothetical protein